MILQIINRHKFPSALKVKVYWKQPSHLLSLRATVSRTEATGAHTVLAISVETLLTIRFIATVFSGSTNGFELNGITALAGRELTGDQLASCPLAVFGSRTA